MLELAEAELEQSEGPLSEEPRRTDLEELLAHMDGVEDHCDEAGGHSECSAVHQFGLVEVAEGRSIAMTANCSIVGWSWVHTKNSTLLQNCASACLNLENRCDAQESKQLTICSAEALTRLLQESG